MNEREVYKALGVTDEMAAHLAENEDYKRQYEIYCQNIKPIGAAMINRWIAGVDLSSKSDYTVWRRAQ